jgi:hypothetical protein
MDRKVLFRQLSILLLVVALFAGFNASLYGLLTCRLSNNFSDSAQPKMVDVGRYLCPSRRGPICLPLTLIFA